MSIKLLFAGALLAFGGTAYAQDRPITQGQLDFIDKSGDGNVSRTEYIQYMQNAFHYLDADGNGTLTRAEIAELLSKSQFDQTDTNGNGTISEAELLNRANADYAAADKDGSGSLN
jgi:Ca2+-binding EF-hand superfamily protein